MNFTPWPQDPAAHRRFSADRKAAGDELGALAHLIAADSLERQDAHELLGVATGYFSMGQALDSARWYRLLLTIDPDCAIAYQNLAAIHEEWGQHDEAEACRSRAYAIQRLFIDDSGQGGRRLLILLAGQGSANTPFSTLVPADANIRIKYALDYAAEAEDQTLPPYDLVFNAIGEPDVAIALQDRLQAFERRCRRPILNPVAAIARTPRHLTEQLLAGLSDVAVSPCARYEAPPASPAELTERLRRDGLSYPLLARPVSSHGGEGLVRCDGPDALMAAVTRLAGPHYLTAFTDYRSADGFFRKYRMIFVDRQPLPYHQAISSDWMVHYFSADMEAHPWKLAEETRYLTDPEDALGSRAMTAIRAIGQRMDLDYGGIDFTLLPDGRVFVFEANATMLVHREKPGGPLTHKNAAVQHIADAFEALLARRTSRA